MTQEVRTTARATQRLQTRERILGAAVAEFKASGMAGADVSVIVAAAGVAQGTFYFHFPTKEHVVLELERREEARIAVEFQHFLASSHDLAETLTKLVESVMGIERRFGGTLFKEILALHFSPSRPESEDWTDHPVIVLLVGEIERGRGHGVVHPEGLHSTARCSSSSGSTGCSAPPTASMCGTPCSPNWLPLRFADWSSDEVPSHLVRTDGWRQSIEKETRQWITYGNCFDMWAPGAAQV